MWITVGRAIRGLEADAEGASVDDFVSLVKRRNDTSGDDAAFCPKCGRGAALAR